MPRTSRPTVNPLHAVALAYTVWAALFIYHSSVIAIDGQRYFCLFDDALITLRYAWNLMHGYGLVWNPGEYVEGQTNFLQCLLMLPGAAVLDKSGAALSTQVLGVFVMLWIGYATMRLADGLVCHAPEERRIVRMMGLACGLSYYPLSYWTLMGMETGLFAALLLAAMVRVVERGAQPRVDPLFAGLLGLAYLTRPDAVVPAGLLLLWRAARVRRHPRGWRTWAVECAVVGAFVLGLTAFRWQYYGHAVPNTYTLKIVGVPLAQRLARGMSYTRGFAKTVPFVIAFVLLNTWRHRRRPATVVAAGVCALAVVYQAWIGGDAWRMWRMVAPVLPLALLLAVDELRHLVRLRGLRAPRDGASAEPPPLGAAGWAAVAVGWAGLIGMANWAFWPEATFRRPPFEVTTNQTNVSKSILISRATRDDATVAVYHAGAIPYFTGRRGVDLLGKCDPYIASRPPRFHHWDGSDFWTPGHNKYDLEYSIGRLKPTFVQDLFPVVGYEDFLQEQREQHYVAVGPRIAEGYLYFRKGSPSVYWDRISRARPEPG